MTAGDRIRRRIEALYGADLAATPPRLLHVAAVWQGRRGEWVNIAAGLAAPRSATDAFVLWLARARADVLVTTGRILRSEPRLAHDFAAPEARGLLAWRREVLGKPALPTSVVLSSGRELDLAHPLLHGQNPALVFTGASAAAALSGRARAAGVELVSHPEPDLPALLRWLRARGEGAYGPPTVLIEAGPSTARALYRPGAGEVDELMLSICLAPRLADAARAGSFIDAATLARSGLVCASERARLEESGPWLFRRLLRAAAGASS